MAVITDKWGLEVAERGFAQLPNYLLNINQFIDPDERLSPVELLVIFQLVASWWKVGELPFPSMSTLATRCGVSARQVQRSINRLEALGMIKRVNRRKKGIIASNAYDLSPLVELLKEISKAFPNAFPRKVSIKGEKPSKITSKKSKDTVEVDDLSAEDFLDDDDDDDSDYGFDEE